MMGIVFMIYGSSRSYLKESQLCMLLISACEVRGWEL
jgi:hypothetical protein